MHPRNAGVDNARVLSMESGPVTTLQPVTQSEVSQREKNKYQRLTHTYGLWKIGTDGPGCRAGRGADAESALVGAAGEGGLDRAESGPRSAEIDTLLLWLLSCSALSGSPQPRGLQPARLPCPWDSPGRDTEGAAISFSRGSSPPRDGTCVSSIRSLQH